jgi:hypothetical protein
VNAQTKPESQQRVADFLLLYRTDSHHEALAILGMLFILVVFRMKAFLQLGTSYMGGSEADAGLYIWLMRSNIDNLSELSWFNTRAFYPYTRTLAWSDNFILPSLFAWPFLKLGVPLVIIYNSLLLLAGWLNGYCTYRLCYMLLGKFFPAFIAGAAFMTYSSLTGNLGHPQLQFFFWIPLSLTYLFQFLSRPCFRNSSLIGLSIFYCFLCTVYYAIFIPIAVGSILAVVALLRPRQFHRGNMATLVGGILCGLAPVVFFAGPYVAVRNTFGERALYEAYYFSATALSYLSASPFNLLYGGTSDWSHAEANLFPGFAVLVLVASAFPRLWGAKPLHSLARSWGYLLVMAFILSAAHRGDPNLRFFAALTLWLALGSLLLLTYRMGLIERKLGFHILTNRGLTAAFLFTALLFVALSFGPLANSAKGQWSFSVYRFFYELFPGFNSMRAIGRSGLVAVFFMSVVTAFTLSILAENKRLATPLLSMVLGLCLLENYVPLYPLDSLRPIPTAMEYLATQADDKTSAVIMLPLVSELSGDGTVKSWSEFARLNTAYMNWMTGLEMPLVNGYSGQRSKLMKELPAQVISFPDQRSLTALRTIGGLRYIVYASKFDPGFRKADFERRIADLPGDLRQVLVDDEGTYLLELIGSARIKTDTFVLVPSTPPGTVYVELMALYQKIGPDVGVEVFATNHSKLTPISTVQIKQNGEWERFEIKLPKTLESVRPNNLTFRIESDVNVYMRETRYSPKQ